MSSEIGVIEIAPENVELSWKIRARKNVFS